jgi:adenylosuccinate synthase
LNGKTVRDYPADLPSREAAQPVYETFEGWGDDLTGVRRTEDLPVRARKYIEWLEALCGVPVVMLSVGPERDQVVPRGFRF